MKKLKEYKELVNKVEQARDEKAKEELDKWDKMITEIKPQ